VIRTLQIGTIIALTFTLALGLIGRVLAEENDQTAYVFPVIPDEATKVWALKRAYQLNGNSMVGNNRMIDLSDEAPFANPVKTEKITAPVLVAAPTPEALMKPVADICRRHGMRKVVTGNSWRCRK
jgi:hypothetical protein